MGCDIHFYKEKLVDGQWQSADEWEEKDYGDGAYQQVPYEKQFNDRNYNLFGLLAKGVRSEHPFSLEPRGLPYDLSEQVKKAATGWDGDGHSHSYLYLHELKSLRSFLERQTIKIEGMKNKDQLAEMQATIDAGIPNWDLLWPYCKWGTSPDLVEFCMDIPASITVGDGLDKIISSFEGVDGDNHRAVFWFDN